MEVASFIREYLYKQDYLDVPGLGTFFLSKDPFSVDNPQNKIKPSVKTLIFRENTRVTGESLIHFMARRKQISLDEAKTSINQFTTEIRNLVKRKGMADILGFGKFTSEDGISLDFKAHPNNYSAASFGLGELNLPPLEKKLDFQSLPDNSHSLPSNNFKDPGSANLSIESKQESFSGLKSPSESFQEKEDKLESYPIQDTSSFLTSPPVSEPFTLSEPSIPSENGIQVTGENLLKAAQEPEEHLPTAEELYQTYHFNKEKTSSAPPNPIENGNLEAATLSKPEINLPIREENPTFPVPTETQNKEEALKSSLVENFVEEKKVITDPLAHPEINFVPNPQPVYSTVKDIPHPPVFETKEEEELSPLPGNSRGFVWVWILSSLFLLATLGGLAYIEKKEIYKNLHRFFPGVQAFKPKDTIKKVITIDSISLAAQKEADSIRALLAQDSLVKKDTSSVKSIAKDSSKNSHTSESLVNSTKNTKPLNDSKQFLVIGADYNLAVSATNNGDRLFGKKGIDYFIIDATKNSIFRKEESSIPGGEPLKKPMKYLICLGEFSTEADAKAKIKELMTSPNFKGLKKPFIFTNKFFHP